jgi:predicted DCC family thiol-disulfide oxidoreductase YuxK
MIVYYDGFCGLCNRFVRWALRHDAERRLQFATLQGPHGVQLRTDFPQTRAVESIVVRDGARVRVRSDAVLAIARELGGIWRLAVLARVVPRPLRDRMYNAIAWRRYRWFGRLESCPLPPADARDRFLDAGGSDSLQGRND